MPEPQTYANHVHQPRLFVAGALAWLAAVIAFGLTLFGYHAEGAGRLFGLVALGVALAIGRTYITALQNRIIKLEMQLRCERLLAPEQQALFGRLEMPQIVALRFASDAELPALAARAVAERLTNDQIKRAIQTWRPDYDRT